MPWRSIMISNRIKSQEYYDAIDRAFKKLEAMSDEELKAYFDTIETSDLTDILIESGAAEILAKELKENYDPAKKT